MWERGRNVTGSLSERLSQTQAPRSRSSGMQVLQNSIRHNLNNVLNTRPGSCQSAPEMGIPDPGSEEQASGGFRETQVEKIRHCILCYEPRISHVEVNAVNQDENSPLDLHFQITAFVDIEGRKNVLQFNVRLDGCQHYRMD